jgi:hypothetical protein
MTDQHPITPPPELVASLRNSAPYGIQVAFGSLTRETWLINHAYAAGAEKAQALADQELEACCLLLDDGEHAASYGCHNGTSLRNARRPKPPSLKEQALALVTHDFSDQPYLSEEGYALIRRALEALDD